MDECIYALAVTWMNKLMHAWADSGQVYEWMPNGWVDRWTNAWMILY